MSVSFLSLFRFLFFDFAIPGYLVFDRTIWNRRRDFHSEKGSKGGGIGGGAAFEMISAQWVQDPEVKEWDPNKKDRQLRCEK